MPPMCKLICIIYENMIPKRERTVYCLILILRLFKQIIILIEINELTDHRFQGVYTNEKGQVVRAHTPSITCTSINIILTYRMRLISG